jgi:hypothetical protein
VLLAALFAMVLPLEKVGGWTRMTREGLLDLGVAIPCVAAQWHDDDEM